MSVIERAGHCPVCDCQRLFRKQRINHVLHVILSVLTVGLWLPVWLIVGINNAGLPYQCTHCGSIEPRRRAQPPRAVRDPDSRWR